MSHSRAIFPMLLGLLACSCSRPAPEKPPRNTLALSAVLSGADYRLTWDAGSTVVATAKAATFTIEDGDFKRELPLDLEQLRSGNMLYSPATGNVAFRLSVTGPTPEPFVESVRVAGAAPPPSPGAGVPVVSAVEAASLPSAADTKSPERKPSQMPVSAPQTAAATAPSSAQQAQQPPQVTSQQPPAQPAPASAPVRQVPAASPPDEDPALPQPQAAVPKPQPSPPVQPAPQVAAQPPAQQAAAAPAPRAVSQYIAPKPVQQVSPKLNPSAKSFLRMLTVPEARIDINIRLDANGNVIGTESLNRADSLQKALSAIAMDAARQWKFEPGRLNGQAIPTEAVISFRFARLASGGR